MYIINENVFLMVVMGYTTAKAMRIKARFIQANDFLGMNNKEIYNRVREHFFVSQAISEK